MIMWEDTTPEGVETECSYNIDTGIFIIVAKKGEIKKKESFEQNFQPTNGMDDVDFITSVTIAENLAELF